MKRSALDSARGILDAKASRSLFGVKRVDQPQLTWEAPDQSVFHGVDRRSLPDESSANIAGNADNDNTDLQ